MARRKQLLKILDQLEKFYGTPEPPPAHNAFELILWENAGYLIDDPKRHFAFSELKRRIGLTPEAILDASEEDLEDVARLGGIMPQMRVEKWLDCARIVQQKLQDDLDGAIGRSLKDARKALRLFPSIGEPGANKILLFARKYVVFALESNGVRTLVRIGFTREAKSYSATYRAVMKAIEPQLKQDYDWLIRAYLLLRHHGQQLCKETRPLCRECPILRSCDYGSSL